MSARMRRVVAERTRSGRIVWHLPEGEIDQDYWWQPIRCGGGIALPAGMESRPESDVCPGCLTGTVTI